ncbi:HAMP domain-containing sensor histidine kinase [Novipirellula caenicola]|uniref:histidine kinase n=1 Tax=Novipirellula caenicola TaxID=1536901 RepID=A0ABP9VMM7_9BACT
MSPTHLLPSLRFESSRWWLPRSLVATECLTGVLLRSHETDLLAAGEQGVEGGVSQSPDPITLQRTIAALRTDPPLLIFAAASFPGDSTSLTGLAAWLAENAITPFSEGDAFLGAPVITSAIRSRWSELDAYFRTLPVEQWLAEATLWLEVTGPSVAASWRDRWPSVTFTAAELNGVAPSPTPGMAAAEIAAADSLHQLARQMQHTRTLERSFDRRLHTQKLAALKQFAYGLSHEINNPLANISTRAQQLKQGEADPQRSASLQKIVDQVYRAHQMIADLMFYANPPLPETSQCDLNKLVRSVADEFVDEADSLSIRLETETSVDELVLDLDEPMFGEALRVLLRNSIEAIGSSGTIVVSVVSEATRILIHVADSGPGLSRAAREHAFDPYFSGREAGRGLGLGLCRAYRIAKLHNADITLAGGAAGCVATITMGRSPA